MPAEPFPFAPDAFRKAYPLEEYATVGDGRSLAVIGPDGAVAWWCVPNLDSDALCDSLLDAHGGGFLALQPTEPFRAERRYRPDSNVLETIFTTPRGSVCVTDSMNSSLAGRLPWCELARRVVGLEGTVTMQARFAFGTRANSVSPWLQSTANGCIFHVGPVLGRMLTTPNFKRVTEEDRLLHCEAVIHKGEHAIVAVVTDEEQVLGIPALEDVDARIETSSRAWCAWAQNLAYDGPHRDLLRRSALVLKLLLFSPTGAIAAAGTTSLPERLGGDKNWEYRYAWVRDAGYTLDAFLRLGQVPESQAALAWLLHRLSSGEPKMCYRLNGQPVPPPQTVEMPGYMDSRPVVTGNKAEGQHQHGIYGDIFQSAALFVGAGGVVDQGSAGTLARLADECTDRWHQKDSSIWELEEPRHYTISKISCWVALNRAVELAEKGHIPAACVPRWERERERIAAWIKEHCWSEEKQAYTFYAGTDRLDASLALAARFSFDGADRLSSTLDAIRRELAHGPWVYRYSGAQKEEGAFTACSFWLAEGYAQLGRRDEAARFLDEVIQAMPSRVGILSEMVDPQTGNALGNLPQGLSHLALVHAILSVYPQEKKS